MTSRGQRVEARDARVNVIRCFRLLLLLLHPVVSCKWRSETSSTLDCSFTICPNHTLIDH